MGAMKDLVRRVYDCSPRVVVDGLRLFAAQQKAKRMADCPAPILRARYYRRRNPKIAELLGRASGGEPIDTVLSGFDARQFDERMAEYPYASAWLHAHARGLDLLDVGCVMNNALVSSLLRERCRTVWFCNPATEPLAIQGVPVFYHVSELDNAFPSGQQFPLVTCLSTLEHVGYDNSQYGVKADARYREPSTEPFITAFEKLAALTGPGGSVLISFPFGKREALIHPGTAKPASQVMDHESLQECLPALTAHGVDVEVTVFAASANGWHRTDPASCNARYADGCPAAAAVAFINGKKGGLPPRGER